MRSRGVRPSRVREEPANTWGLFLSHLGAYPGLGGRLGIRTPRAPRTGHESPARFDTAGKSSNKTTVQYGPRFDTAREIIKRYQRMTKSHPFRHKSNKINNLAGTSTPNATNERTMKRRWPLSRTAVRSHFGRFTRSNLRLMLGACIEAAYWPRICRPPQILCVIDMA